MASNDVLDADLAMAIQLQAQFNYANSGSTADYLTGVETKKKKRKVARIISLLDSDSDDCDSFKENKDKKSTESIQQQLGLKTVLKDSDMQKSLNSRNSDFEIAKCLQEELNRDLPATSSSSTTPLNKKDVQSVFHNGRFDTLPENSDFELAKLLQEELNKDVPKPTPCSPTCNTSSISNKPANIVDDNWELIDPIPDIHSLFITFNEAYFFGRLLGIEVKWSPKMTVCAGLCCYEGRGGLCSVRLSEPLLKLRPRRDLVQTLLHEMIHAFLFVTGNNKDHDAHGPEFHKHMNRINAETGAKITVYHSFHDEVNLYKQHWWRCNGPCRERKPFYGYVKRTMNRPPQPADSWWKDHQAKCNGLFIKIKEPEPTAKRKTSTETSASKRLKTATSPPNSKDIRSFFNSTGNSNEKKGSNVHTLNDICDLDKASGSGVKNPKSTQSNTKKETGSVSQVKKVSGGLTKMNGSSTVTVTNNKKGKELNTSNNTLANPNARNVHTISSFVTSSPEKKKSVPVFFGKGHVLGS